MDPFNEMNKALRDRDGIFTKREMIAMHLTAALIQKATPDTMDKIPDVAIKVADILLEKLRVKP